MSKQIPLEFAPGLTDRYKSLKEVLNAAVSNCPEKQSTIAGACDLSPSDLSKQLSGYEGRKLDVDLLEPIVASTGDLRPIFYLIERFIESPETKRDRAIAELSAIAKVLPELLKKAGAK